MLIVVWVIDKLIFDSLDRRYSEASDPSRVPDAISPFEQGYDFFVFGSLCLFGFNGPWFPSYLPALFTKVLISRLKSVLDILSFHLGAGSKDGNKDG